MRGLRRVVFIALFLGLLVGGWEFAGRNLEPIEIDFLLGSLAGIPLWKALLAAGILGAGTVLLPLTLSLMRGRMEARRYRKEMGRLEKELRGLRPIEDADVEGAAAN